MTEWLDFLRLFGGFVYLVLGGDLLVRGALGLSRRTSISPVLIGLTVVAFGTSAPELVISVLATAQGVTGVALGNVVGSNIANIVLVLGLPALIHPLVSRSRELTMQTVFMVLVSIAFVALAADGSLSRIDGSVLVVVLVAMLAVAYRRRLAVPGVDSPDEDEQFERVLGLPNRVPVAMLFLVLGIVLLPLGADLTVTGAVGIARSFDIPDILIGSTIVALGTSLPELSTTIIAAFHRSADIALGNVIGSNVFNILLVAGTSALVAPLPVPEHFRDFDLWLMLAIAVVFLLFIAARWPIGRIAGLVCTGVYAGYCLRLV